MSVSNGKISYRMEKKIGVNGDGDLERVFGVTQKKQHSWFFLGENGSAAHINMWAKYKPFRHPNHTIYTDHYKGPNGEDLPSSARLAGARAVNYGLVPPTVSASGSFGTISDVYGKLWSYAPCQDNIDPMQAFDFEAYYHNALPPIMPLSNGELDPVLGSIVPYYTAFMGDFDFSSINRGTRDDSVGLADFADIDGWYVCVALCNSPNFSSTNNFRWKTASAPISLSQYGPAPTVPCPVLTATEMRGLGNYKNYYMCLADTRYDDWSQNQPVTMFKPLPAGSILDLKGQFYVTNQVVTRLVLTHASFVGNPGVSSYADITSYTGPGDTYYNVNNNYYVAFKVVLTGPSTAVTLQESLLKMSLSTTFMGGSPSLLNVQLYNSSYTRVSSLQIPANTDVTAYIVCPAAALSIDPSGNETVPTDNGVKIDTRVIFSHNGITFSNDQAIRLTN